MVLEVDFTDPLPTTIEADQQCDGMMPYENQAWIYTHKALLRLHSAALPCIRPGLRGSNQQHFEAFPGDKGMGTGLLRQRTWLVNIAFNLVSFYIRLVEKNQSCRISICST